MTTSIDFDAVIRELAEGGGPVLEGLAQMNLGLLDAPSLDARTVLLMRLAALVALDAPAPSYLVTLAMAEQSGITTEDVQAALVTLAPVVGGPRIVSAAAKVTEAIRIARA